MRNDDIFLSGAIKAFKPNAALDLDESGNVKYHYTSPGAFLSIIKNKKLRFSDIRFMNDKSEGVFFVKLLLDFIEKYKAKYPKAEQAIHLLLEPNNEKDIQELRVSQINYTEFPKLGYSPQRTFLVCAADKPDLLNMWNYYIHNNVYEGYNIGFNIPKLLKTFDTNAFVRDPFIVYYGDVLYQQKDQESEISRLLAHIEKMADNATDNSYEIAAITLRNYIESQGYFFKHKSFAAETEFRIIVSISDARIKKKKADKNWESNMKEVEEDFFIRNGLVVPCFAVAIPDDAISRIYLSPVAEEEIAKNGVRELIEFSGFVGVKIYKSNIPIRF